MDKNATKYKSVDEYDDPANESVEKEASESKATEHTEIITTALVANTNGPDNMSFQTEVSGASASKEAVYLQQQESFQLPSYEPVQAINTIQATQENYSGGGRKKNKNENIRLTETSDNGVIRCFACGIESRDWIEQDNAWEWHARLSSFCSHIETEGKMYFELQYLDLKSKKKQDRGDQWELLKKWLLCKLCYMNISNLVLLPCRHVCLCTECADNVTVCPNCDSHILQHVQASLDILTAQRET